MSSALTDPQIRTTILSDPKLLLDDTEIMNALVGAEASQRGSNVIDLRGAAMERLEDRLGQLEDTHRTVIAAAYENIAGMTLVHRAVLDLVGARDLGEVLTLLGSDVAETLKVDSLRLVLEDAGSHDPAHLDPYAHVLGLAERGFCSLFAGRERSGAPQTVTLRHVDGGHPGIHGDDAGAIRSEACLLLDLGDAPATGMLILGAADPAQFGPGQGADLLTFLAEVLQRVLRRHLS